MLLPPVRQEVSDAASGTFNWDGLSCMMVLEVEIVHEVTWKCSCRVQVLENKVQCHVNCILMEIIYQHAGFIGKLQGV